MSTFNFSEYIAAFNSGDDDGTCERYFTEDFVMQTADRFVQGRAGMRDFFRLVHDGVREILRPQIVAQDAHYVLAEIDIDFHALNDRPNYPIQPLKKGDLVTVKFFCVYTLRGSQIAQLKTARWPVSRATSPARPLGV
jgi:SnoaL-like domain